MAVAIEAVEVMPGGWNGLEPGTVLEVPEKIPEDLASFLIGRGFLKLAERKHKPKKFNHQKQ